MWQASQITLALDAPLHLGERASGNLRQTRRYVPGRALWGAITQRLTRFAGGTTPEHYQAKGDWVHRNLRFSYAYLSIHPERIDLWPWGDQDHDSSRFDWLFLQSYTSTALVDGRSSEEGSLHETEYLAPRTRDGQPVYLLFYLWLHQDANLSPEHDPTRAPFWRAMSLGGERGYGWGRVRHVQTHSSPADLFGLWQFDPACHLTPLAEAPPSLAHVTAHSSWTGSVVPLVGRETTNHLPGHRLSTADVLFAPGSRPAATLPPHTIGNYGIWTQIPPVS